MRGVCPFHSSAQAHSDADLGVARDFPAAVTLGLAAGGLREQAAPEEDELPDRETAGFHRALVEACGQRLGVELRAEDLCHQGHPAGTSCVDIDDRTVGLTDFLLIRERALDVLDVDIPPMSGEKVVVAAADSAVLHGLREGWVELPVALLESRVRAQLSSSVPRSFRSELASARWLSVATRLATVRLLEIRRMDETLLRYGMREDAAMRAGFDVLAPGLDVMRVMSSERVRTADVR